MSLPLLQTKLYAPPLRRNRVARPAVTAMLRTAVTHPLTLVAAPAGFGKTTLVREWLAQTDQPVAWLSLDDDDNDPLRFLAYLVAALRTVHPQVGESTLAALDSPQPPPIKTLLTLLINDLDGVAVPFALVLDDYHLIISPTIHEALAFLVDHLPPALHLVLTSRIDPPLPLPRWRVRGQLAEVRTDDLRFRLDEASLFLNETMGLTLTAVEVAALAARTEGWIAGLQLAALSIQGRADVSGFVQSFSGSHRHVLSYLVEEVLNRSPEDILDFLLQTAILERLSASLCQAVTGSKDSQTLLEQIEHANLFLIPLDDERQWYRYHHLFAEVLRSRLQQTQPDMIPQLHQRASAWYAAAGQIETAVGHALAAKDEERAASLVEQFALPTIFQQGEVLLVRRLVERLPPAVINRRPHLTLAYGITLALSGQFEAVEALLRQTAPALSSLELRDETAGGLTALHSIVARFRGDANLTIKLAQQALHQLPVDALALRAGAALNLGAAYLQRGERIAASQALADAIAWGSDGGAAYLALAALEELATGQIRQGHLVQARQTCEQALIRITRRSNQRMPGAGLVHIVIGEVLVEWNERERATQALTLGIQLLQSTTETGMSAVRDMGMLVRGYSALARCQWAEGERAAALTTLQQGQEWLANTQIAAQGAQAWLAAQQARLHLWQGNLAAALAWEQETEPAGESLLGYLQQLTRVRVRLAQHACDPQAGFLQEASDILTPLLSTAETKGWGSHVIEILMLQALIEQAQGQRTAAQTTLARALTLASPAGYLRLFVDEGEAMRFLILDFGFWLSQPTQTEQGSTLSVYVDKLLAAFGSEPANENKSPLTEQLAIANPKPKIQNLVEPLSARELEVLQLVAAGLSNSQIAAQLIVTTGTVKTHINHIFGKLGVKSRTQAVAQARRIGLL